VFRIGVASIALLSVIGAHLLAQANAADPFLGSWLLDRAKSTYSGTPPEKRTMRFEKTAKGIEHTTETEPTLGGAVKLVYTFQVDGKDYVADVQMPVSTVSFKRIDAKTLERTGKYQGEVIETVVYKLSDDGKALTATQNAIIQGQEVTSNQVFTKQ
jgi:hypothetical protein